MTEAPHLRYHPVRSADGTRLRAWTNDAAGPAVLVSNGLGTNPHAWPALLRPDCGVRAISWNHRGVGGSERPADGRVDLDAFVEDALAVMDDAGVDDCVVAGWSAGVTVAFELASRHPERVRGILAVAGVPGDTFSTMLAPLHVPPPVAKASMVGLAHVVKAVGRGIGPVTRRVPWTNLTADAVRASRLIDPSADTGELRVLLQEFFSTDPAWYARLALGVSEHQRISLSGIRVPVTFVAGRRDLLTSSRAMLTASQRVRGSRYREVDATHFIPVEHPDLVMQELLDLVARVG